MAIIFDGEFLVDLTSNFNPKYSTSQ